MTYTVDLCRGWQKIGQAQAPEFGGDRRHLEAGQWKATAADAAVSWSEIDAVNEFGQPERRLATGTDVDTVRLVSDGQVVYSGEVAAGESSGFGGAESTTSSEGVRWSWSGVDEWHALAGRIAYPDPTMEAPWAVSHDVRNAQASTALAAFLYNNMGAGALSDRQVPVSIVDGFAGPSMQWSARLQPLSDLASRICRDAGLACRLERDFDGDLTVTIDQPRDLSARVVFAESDMSMLTCKWVPESANHTLAGGQGAGSSRTFRTASTGATGSARREQFSDQASLSSTAELQQSATATNALSAGTWSITAVPTDDASSRWGIGADIRVGDFVSIQVARRRHRVPVVAIGWSVSAERVQVRPVLGEATSDALKGIVRDVAGLASRFRTDVV